MLAGTNNTMKYANEELIGTRMGRPESPSIELAMQEEICVAMLNLLSTKGLYQNVRVDSSACAKHPESETELRREFSKRPWEPVSLGHADSLADRGISFHAGLGGEALGTPPDEMRLNFPLPDIETWCNECGKPTAHASTFASRNSAFGKQFPILGEQTIQVFIPYYICSLCRRQILVFLIKRKGYTMQLCGRSERLHFDTPRVIPKQHRQIFEDALSAVAENDIAAGFYHLRTFAEHYMKDCLGIDEGKQIRGDDLCDKYKDGLDPRMSRGMPSLSAVYETCSVHMHARTGTPEDFAKECIALTGHLEAKALFGKYQDEGNGQLSAAECRNGDGKHKA